MPRTPPTPPGHMDETECIEIEGMSFRCVHIHSPLPNTELFNHNEYVKDSLCNEDFIPKVLSTLAAAWKFRWHWFWRREQRFGRI
jgi:hypothetical protein